MKFLLDKFIPATTPFVPRTTTDLFALRLAQRLNDAVAVRHYAILAAAYSDSQLLAAYRRTMRTAGNVDLGRRFHSELERAHANGSSDRSFKLIAIRVKRRAVAACIFHGDQLEYTDSRQLSSDKDKALASAVGFIAWMLNRFPVESAALEQISNDQQFQRRALHDAICHEVRDRLLPIWAIPKTALLEGCGHPALRFRAQLRDVVTTIWPVLQGTHAKVFIQDAAILGLHVQTERAFIIN
jgi:hypothetical protein